VISNLTGRRTGLDDQGLKKQQKLLQKAAARTSQHLDVKTALLEYGGFEISMMAGAIVGAAHSNIPSALIDKSSRAQHYAARWCFFIGS